MECYGRLGRVNDMKRLILIPVFNMIFIFHFWDDGGVGEACSLSSIATIKSYDSLLSFLPAPFYGVSFDSITKWVSLKDLLGMCV